MLWPLSCLYRAAVAARKLLYRAGVLRSERMAVPVIVVGNVIAGGAGKTPVTQAIVRHLVAQGWRPGVVSRGYGRSTDDCREVHADSSAAEVGDEPALIARSTGVPVFVARQRTQAARALLARHSRTDVIVCDDGLQHLALARDIEVCVFNDDGVGNGFLLPAGPLREPWPRPVDCALYAGQVPGGTAHAFALTRSLAADAIRADGSTMPLAQLRHHPLHAVAAIARPQEFFAMLRAKGLTLQHTSAFPDHYDFDSWQRNEIHGMPLICTEKDATKLWQSHPQALAVPLQLEIDSAFFSLLDDRLRSATHRSLSSPSD
ncbi:tetraacyldisaccharide 4'-kinase [Acidovorax sp. NCPPB 3576]|nr:tetraacyldisaccharide 4'-kinase [Acidovorax sp. NCPPB 3576]WCM86228.1 tetraacyldisaccharide 4'-kinase [Acidovorax sp. NCPPB 3576]